MSGLHLQGRSGSEARLKAFLENPREDGAAAPSPGAAAMASPQPPPLTLPAWGARAARRLREEEEEGKEEEEEGEDWEEGEEEEEREEEKGASDPRLRSGAAGPRVRVAAAGRPRSSSPGLPCPCLPSPPSSFPFPSLPPLPFPPRRPPLSPRCHFRAAGHPLPARSVSASRWLLRAVWLLPLVTAFTFCLNSSSI